MSVLPIAFAANSSFSEFGSLESQIKNQLLFPVQPSLLFPPAHLQMLYDLSSNSSLAISDSSTTCSSPLSLGSPVNPKISSVISNDLNDYHMPINTVGVDQSAKNLASLTCGSRKNRKLKGDRNRRNRTVFTELQLMGLERRFDSQKYLSTPDRAELARALGLTQLQVKTWYQVSWTFCLFF